MTDADALVRGVVSDMEVMAEEAGWGLFGEHDIEVIESTVRTTLVRLQTDVAGYDVARIEEGERLRAALEWALDYIEDTQALRRPPLAEPFFGQKVAQGRAALAASDEAAK